MSRQSQREQALERLLKESLGTPSREPKAGSCLDAETLAAWVDGSLAGGQFAAAQEHAADCVACQATLAALARTTLPKVSPEPWWRRGLGARWLVPVAATATALAVWVAMPREEYTRPPEQATTAVGQAGARQTEADLAAAPPSEVAAAPSVTVDERTPTVAGSADSQPGEPPAAEFRREATLKEATPAGASAEREDNAPRPRERPAAEPRLEAAVEAAPAAATAAGRDQAPAALGRAAASAPEPVAPPSPAQTARSEALIDRANLAPRRIEIASPDGRSRWRVGSAGAVEYSANAGGTWEATSSGVAVDLTAGASPAGTVCWVVGRAGTVLLTTDGRQWRRLTFPVAADLAAVQATDARTATVTASDGRRFRTVDAGATWESP